MELRLSNLTKQLGKRRVLRGVDLLVPAAAWMSVVGISGAGKTTLLNIIAAVLEPDEGAVIIDGSPSGTGRHTIAYLLQDFPLYPSLIVRANLRLAVDRQFSSRGPTTEELVELLELGPLLTRLPTELSGGERQRVALARTLLLHRPIVLLDEPFSNLDAALRRKIRRRLRETQRAAKNITILVTHDQEDAISTSDLVAFLDDGVLVQHDSPERVFRRPRTDRVAGNFGDVEMVMLAPALSGAFCLEGSSRNGTPALRESDFTVSLKEEEGHIVVQVIAAEFLGSRRRVFVEFESERFSVVIDSYEQIPKQLWVKLRKERLQLYKDGVLVSG